MIFLKPALALTPVLLVVLMMDAASGAPTDCKGVTLDAKEEIALARVTATEPRINFIANPGKRTPACPSAESACRLTTFLVPGDEVLVIATESSYICATFKSPHGAETTGWLPRAALAVMAPKPTSAQEWEGRWRRDGEAEIVLQSHGDEVEVSGQASWGAAHPDRDRRGAVHTGELEGSGKPRDQVLAIGYDPDKSGFPPRQDTPDCAARLQLFGRYLAVEDSGACGGLNVSFSGLYVRAGGK